MEINERKFIHDSSRVCQGRNTLYATLRSNGIVSCLQDGVKATLYVENFTIYASGHLVSS